MRINGQTCRINMQNIESIKRYNFELKISALFIVVAAGWFHQWSARQTNILSQKENIETHKKPSQNVEMAVLKKI